MPNSKRSEVRIKVIDRCLSDRRRRYTTAMIFELCNEELIRKDFQPVSSMNSIRADMDQIQRVYAGADIESTREGRNIYYRYADPSFSIFKIPLRPDEIIQLTQTLRLLQRFKGMPQFDWVDEISERLGFSIKIDSGDTDEIVGFDENLDLEGMSNFTPLFNAIVDKQPLLLTYKSFRQETETTLVVHPYYIKQYNKRWFLIAWNAEQHFLANFAFDRIIGIDEAHVPFRPANIDFFDYFDDMIGVSKDLRTEPQLVKLWVSVNSWPYVKTKPLHGTQHIVKVDEKGAIITIDVYLNYELEQVLMSYGENIEVLEPLAFRERMRQRLLDSIKHYLE